MNARKYANPYKALKAANLPRKQYQAIKGQLKNGKTDEAMRGLERWKEARA